MKHAYFIYLILCIVLNVIYVVSGQYQPNWPSLDSRPLPLWYDQVKFGIFIHWGVYSVPAWAPVGQYAEWYWYNLEINGSATQKFHEEVYGANFHYQEFADDFHAELFDPDEWASLFHASGAKYIVLTSKHHEGYTLWPSAQSWNWNSVDIGPKRDLARELGQAVKAQGLHMGYYYSLYEWFHPLYIGPNPQQYVQEIMLPQMKDVVATYQPDIFWTDGEWEHNSTFWQSPQFLAWLYNESPVKQNVVVNDRWGSDTREKHGGFYTVEYQYGSIPTNHKWESCQGMGFSFGYNRMENTLNAYWNSTRLIQYLVQVVAMGGNLLLDIGPSSDGRVPVEMQERLLDIGSWLNINGEAIYNTTKYSIHNSTGNVWYTYKAPTVYAIFFGWPNDNLIQAQVKATNESKITLIGVNGQLSWNAIPNGISVKLPSVNPNTIPSAHGPWVLKITPAS